MRMEMIFKLSTPCYDDSGDPLVKIRTTVQVGIYILGNLLYCLFDSLQMRIFGFLSCFYIDYHIENRMLCRLNGETNCVI